MFGNFFESRPGMHVAIGPRMPLVPQDTPASDLVLFDDDAGCLELSASDLLPNDHSSTVPTRPNRKLDAAAADRVLRARRRAEEGARRAAVGLPPEDDETSPYVEVPAALLQRCRVPPRAAPVRPPLVPHDDATHDGPTLRQQVPRPSAPQRVELEPTLVVEVTSGDVSPAALRERDARTRRDRVHILCGAVTLAVAVLILATFVRMSGPAASPTSSVPLAAPVCAAAEP
jgi:hypothetical protein